ncbi:MAG TPA: hypothetical protein VGI70_20860 [Polyangiales bacterium]|jgi:hypothetical protein
MADIELSIDELVLHGFAPADRARIGDAVHAELTRLLGGVDQAQLAKLGRVTAVDAGSFQVAANASPRTIGTHVARSIIGSTTGARPGAKR